MVYNSQGKSKGMAIVMFQRPGDAAVAQKKYHGKIVDARMFRSSLCSYYLLTLDLGRPIKIEIMVDYIPSSTTPSTASAPSLLSRIEPLLADTVAPVPNANAPAL